MALSKQNLPPCRHLHLFRTPHHTYDDPHTASDPLVDDGHSSSHLLIGVISLPQSSSDLLVRTHWHIMSDGWGSCRPPWPRSPVWSPRSLLVRRDGNHCCSWPLTGLSPTDARVPDTSVPRCLCCRQPLFAPQDCTPAMETNPETPAGLLGQNCFIPSP